MAKEYVPPEQGPKPVPEVVVKAFDLWIALQSLCTSSCGFVMISGQVSVWIVYVFVSDARAFLTFALCLLSPALCTEVLDFRPQRRYHCLVRSVHVKQTCAILGCNLH